MFSRDSDGLPTGDLVKPGPRPWDDCFTQIRGVPQVVYEGAARIYIESDAPYWVVYDEDQEGVCVEPQTAPPDAANLDIKGEHYLEVLFTFEEDF
jgi:aldose 1-epimerase